MAHISKFMENELDRVSQYLSMAKANLIVTSEMCRDRCKTITPNLSDIDIEVVNYLDPELEKINSKISDACEIICEFKKFYFNTLEKLNYTKK